LNKEAELMEDEGVSDSNIGSAAQNLNLEFPTLQSITFYVN